jgi:hypothetical protein
VSFTYAFLAGLRQHGKLLQRLKCGRQQHPIQPDTVRKLLARVVSAPPAWYLPILIAISLGAGNILIYGVFCKPSLCSSDIAVLTCPPSLPVAVYTATLTHAFLYHRREIAHGFKSILSRKKTSEIHKDIHTALMMSYKEVPEWQYLMSV